MDEYIANSRHQITKHLLELARKFARKSRRSSTQLTCTDLLNAFQFAFLMSRKKIVYYLRHFEALHNIPPYDYSLRDPGLTPLGQTQAKPVIEMIEKIPAIDLIVCSPLTRTLQTYLLLFDHRIDLPLIIHPDLQEKCSELCDIGSPLADLLERFPSLSKELNTFAETFGADDWLEKTNPDSIYSPTQVKQRAKRFHQWLINRPEEHIFVISHNLMLKELLIDPQIDLQNGQMKTIEYHC